MKPKSLALLLIALTIVVFLIFFLRTPRMADVLLYNGSVYTVDPEFTVAEAVAVRGEKIVGVGTSEELLKKFKPKETVDLQGKPVYPGFIDAHAHFLGLGLTYLMLDFVGTTSAAQIAAMVKDRALELKPGRWIRGHGWDQNDWDVKQFPTHEILDAVAPDNPVYLWRIDGHAVWVSRQVMELAGITPRTRDPEGGRIIRDSQGNPTGVFIDNAVDLIRPIIPDFSSRELKEAALLASRVCAKVGLTSVHDMGAILEELTILKELANKGDFPVRIYATVEGSDTATWKYYMEHGREVGLAGDRLTIRGIKVYVDGALGSPGAALIDSYSDETGNRGLTRTSESELHRICLEAIDRGFQVCTHAIGDRGNHIALNAYEKALKRKLKDDHRFRIEHVQVLHPDDIPRFRQLNVIPSMQPTHCTSDMYWAIDSLGPERARGAYAWRSLLNTGVIMPGGSDSPVENPNPLWGIYAAVTRQDHRGWPEGGWYPEERMSIEEAIRSFTNWAAYAAFEENLKGSIEVGKFADLVVLSKDIMSVPPREILTSEVLMTMLGGTWVYKKAEEVSVSQENRGEFPG